MKIVTHPSRFLYERCFEVAPECFGAELDATLDAMIATMLAPRASDGKPQGVGLAAPQTGLLWRAIVMHADEKAPVYKMVNPRILRVSDQRETRSESCLSLPGVDVNVSRACAIVASWQDPLTAKRTTATFAGYEARILQHEIEHLDGITLVAHMRGGQRHDYLRANGPIPTPTAPAGG